MTHEDNMVPRDEDKKEIVIFDSSLAKRGLDLISKLNLKDIIHIGKRISSSTAPQVSLIDQFGEGTLSQLIWSPEGSFIVGATLAGLYIYDSKDFNILHVINSPSVTVALSHESSLLASASPDGRIMFWQVSDWRFLRSLEAHKSKIYSLAFSPNGTLLASSSEDNTIRIWRTSDGVLLTTLGENIEKEYDNGLDGKIQELLRVHSMYCLAFSPDNSLLASGSFRNIFLWRVEDGSLYKTIGEHQERIKSIAFSPDGALLASGELHDVFLWQVSDGSLIWKSFGDSNYVNSLSFSPNGNLLSASGSFDKKVLLLRVSDGTLIASLEKHQSAVESVSFSPDGTLLASGSIDGTVCIWRIMDKSLFKLVDGKSSSVHCIDISPDNAYLASGSYDHKVRI